MVREMDSGLILLASWMMALARHCRWDLHLLIMEAAFLFGCHSFSASDSVGVSGERFEVDGGLHAWQLFWRWWGSESTKKTASHVIQGWIRRGNFWVSPWTLLCARPADIYSRICLLLSPGGKKKIKSTVQGLMSVSFIFPPESQRVQVLH